jgi:uncharacterized delta-60 repeat protein
LFFSCVFAVVEVQAPGFRAFWHINLWRVGAIVLFRGGIMLNSHQKSSRWCFYFLIIVVALAFALAALLVGSGLAASGDLDPTFSLDGVTSVNFGTGTSDKAQAVYTAGSRIYTAGTSDGDLSVAVFTPDGVLDSSFDGDGIATYPFSGEKGGAFDLVLQENKLLVAGFLTASGGVEKAPALFRLTTSGVLDSTFGSAGVVTSTVGTEAAFAALALDGSGNILAAGTVDGDAFIAKFDANGVPDQNFGAMGVVRFSFGGVDGNENIHALVVSGADVFVGGFTDLGGASDEFAVARLSLDTGSFVTTFGSNGQAIAGYAGSSNDQAYAMAIDSAGRILLAGYTDYGVFARQIAVTRLNAAGSIDSSFGLAGWTVSDLGSLGAEAYGVDVLPTGKIMVSGWSDLTATAHDFSIVRLGAEWRAGHHV